MPTSKGRGRERKREEGGREGREGGGKGEALCHFSFYNLTTAQIQTYNFRKVVQQHTEGMVGSIMCFFVVGNLLLFPTVKEF